MNWYSLSHARECTYDTFTQNIFIPPLTSLECDLCLERERISSGQGYRERLCMEKRHLKEKSETQEQERDSSRREQSSSADGCPEARPDRDRGWRTGLGATENGLESLSGGPSQRTWPRSKDHGVHTGKNLKRLNKACEQFCDQNCALINTSCKIINQTLQQRNIQVRTPDKGSWREIYKRLMEYFKRKIKTILIFKVSSTAD